MSQAKRKKASQHVESEEKKEVGETHRVILPTAHQLVSSYGYLGVTSREISSACGITHAALYRHFSNKQDIYTAMLLAANVQVKAALERISQRNIPVSERLQLAALYLLNNTQQDIGMMVHNIQHELTAEARMLLENAFIEGTVQPLASIFEDGVRQGFLRPSQQGGFTSIAAALLFLNVISHFISVSDHASSSESRLRKDEQAGFLVQFCLHGMAYPDHQERKGM